METLITETLVKIKPTDPLRLVNQTARIIETDLSPQVVHGSGQMPHDECVRKADG